MAELAPLPAVMPDLKKVILPSRSFFLSWREQTLPARLAAIEDSAEHYESVAQDGPISLRDMALAGLICDAVQPLEDLAYLATAWDSPYPGLATYVKATTWDRFKANNFWQEAKKWDDDRLDVFAGFSGRDPQTRKAVALQDGFESLGVRIGEPAREAMEAARQATLKRLRKLLQLLGVDWKQFSPYYLAYKHGGLIVHREDVVFVEDEVEEITDSVERHDPSIAVWTRAGRKQDLMADFNLSHAQLADYAAGTGRLAVDLCDAFIASRLANIEALVFEEGDLVGLTTMQLPWTVWLREQDLDRRFWELLGDGPRITWISDQNPK